MSSGLDYIPTQNTKFDPWQVNFVTQVNLFKAGWNWNSDATNEWALLTSAAVVPPATYGNKQARWAAAWLIVGSKNFRHSDETELQKARQSYESGDKNNPADTSIRLFIKRYIANNVKVTPQQKKAMGITVEATTHSLAANPTERTININTLPQLNLKKQGHLEQVIEITYPGTKSKKKPKGVKEVMFYILVQAAGLAAPTDPSTFTYVGDMKRGLFKTEFTAAQEGMKAYYCMREKSTKGVLGAFIHITKGFTIS